MTDIDLSTTDDPHGECRHHRGPHFLAPATEERELADLIDSLARLPGTVTLGLHRYGLCCQAVWLLMGNGMLWGEVPGGSLFNLAPEKARDGAIALTLHGWEQLSDEEGGQSFRLEASVPLHTGLVATAALVAVREALQANPNDVELYATWDPERAPAPPWEEHATDCDPDGTHTLPIALLRVAPHLYPVHLLEVIGLLEKWYWSESPQLGMHAWMPNNPEDEEHYGTGITPSISAVTEHALPLAETASRSEVDYPLEGPVWQTIEDVVIALASTAMYPSSSTEHQREAVAAFVECAVGQAIGLARVVRRLAKPHGQPWAGRGWYPLLGRLDSLLVCVDPDYRITEFKEKFGCLRFHMASSPMITGEDSMLIRRLVAAAAAASKEICERCGRPGRLAVRGHRYQTLCEICGPARLGWTLTS